jgi:pimeloyl-ACP methyl ester carboxylesterase
MLRYDARCNCNSQSDQRPALVLAGDSDPVCKPEASKRVQREIPGAQLAPAKHMGLMELHTHFAEIVSKFSFLCFPPISANSHINN